MTFNQQLAYENRKIMFVNLYHPIIQACLNYFEIKHDKTKTSFCYALKEDDTLSSGDSFYLAIYQMSICRKVMGIDKHTHTLLPLLYSINNQSIVTDEDIVNHIFAKSQIEGIEHNPNNKDLDSEMLQDIRYDFAEALNIEKNKCISELRLQIESERQRFEKQNKEYYTSVINNQRKFIKNWEDEIEMLYSSDEKRVRQLQNTIHLAKNRIERYLKEQEERLEQINDAAQIEISDKIISLNLINVI